MEKKKEIKIYSIILLVLIYLILTSIPFSLFIQNENTIYFLDISLRVIFIPIYFIYIRREKLESIKKPSFNKRDLLFIPFILVTISNIFVALISQFEINELNNISIIKNMIFYALVAFNEELIFRVTISSELIKYNSKIKTIIYSSLIFGLIHLVNISSLSSIPYVLLQVLYSFGLGLILSLVYTYSNNFIYIVIIHFLFDFINGYLSVELFKFEYNMWFFILNISISLLFVLYGLLVYKKLERGDKNVSKNMDI